MNELSRAAELAAAQVGGLTLYARQWLDAESARDAVQDALASLLGQKTCPDDPVAWMYRAVRNRAIDLGRSRWRRRRCEVGAAAERVEWFVPGTDAGIDALSAQKALERLGIELRETVVLRIWGELGFVEIARVTEVSVGTAHQRYGEALRQMREALES